MAPYILEVHRINADKVWQVTSKYMHPLVDAVKTVPGIKVGFFGQQWQDNKQLYFVQLWESYDKHRELLRNPANWAEVQKHIDVISSQQVSYSGAVDVDPTPAFAAPITEILHLRANDGVSREETLIPIFSSLVDIIRAIPGVTGTSFGPVLEDENSIAFVSGWQSMEHFTESVKNSADLQEKIGQLKQIATVELKHAKLSSYKLLAL